HALDGQHKAVIALAGHQGVGDAATGVHGPVGVVHQDGGGVGGHAVVHLRAQVHLVHIAAEGGAPLVDVHIHAGLDVGDVPLVHVGGDLDDGGVGDVDDRGLLRDLLPRADGKADDRPRDGGHGVEV